ncbi:hypothetical protein HYH03_004053 [Edaphochlamys debaryana]|uniref:cyclin-dependent kinase n=1 Tax=Edaphochlamys debaryana TaxID=47281 RepID=A0A835YBH9_9CHLO|nr:hypothetical protein HYH03_004053 [Edaphochlamys debaryana]|eukprot:KAG2497781.1 hypothetical protein HYH03_004053 [Edaphochlamys debaryana]
MQAYEYVATLGEGAYGEVWKCLERASGRMVAIKGFKQAHEDKDIMRLAVREAKMLESLDHPNLVKMLAAFRSKTNRVYMVFEFVGPSVHQELDSHPSGLPSSTTKLVTWQLLRAAAHLHSRKMLHRDIKPANVLMQPDDAGGPPIAKLCDFGFARNTRCGPRDVQRCTSYCVTRWYRAPEIMVGDLYGPSSDVWSIGCTIAEAATGRPLFPGDSTADQLWRIMRCFGPLPPRQAALMAADSRLRPLAVAYPSTGRTLRERLPELEPRLFELVEACLKLNPWDRPTALDLLQMPYYWDVPRLIAGTQMEEWPTSASAGAPAPAGGAGAPAKRQAHRRASATVQGSTAALDSRPEPGPRGAPVAVDQAMVGELQPSCGAGAVAEEEPRQMEHREREPERDPAVTQEPETEEVPRPDAPTAPHPGAQPCPIAVAPASSCGPAVPPGPADGGHHSPAALSSLPYNLRGYGAEPSATHVGSLGGSCSLANEAACGLGGGVVCGALSTPSAPPNHPSLSAQPGQPLQPLIVDIAALGAGRALGGATADTCLGTGLSSVTGTAPGYSLVSGGNFTASHNWQPSLSSAHSGHLTSSMGNSLCHEVLTPVGAPVLVAEPGAPLPHVRPHGPRVGAMPSRAGKLSDLSSLPLDLALQMAASGAGPPGSALAAGGPRASLTAAGAGSATWHRRRFMHRSATTAGFRSVTSTDALTSVPSVAEGEELEEAPGASQPPDPSAGPSTRARLGQLSDWHSEGLVGSGRGGLQVPHMFGPPPQQPAGGLGKSLRKTANHILGLFGASSTGAAAAPPAPPAVAPGRSLPATEERTLLGADPGTGFTALSTRRPRSEAHTAVAAAIMAAAGELQPSVSPTQPRRNMSRFGGSSTLGLSSLTLSTTNPPAVPEAAAEPQRLLAQLPAGSAEAALEEPPAVPTLAAAQHASAPIAVDPGALARSTGDEAPPAGHRPAVMGELRDVASAPLKEARCPSRGVRVQGPGHGGQWEPQAAGPSTLSQPHPSTSEATPVGSTDAGSGSRRSEDEASPRVEPVLLAAGEQTACGASAAAPGAGGTGHPKTVKSKGPVLRLIKSLRKAFKSSS